ncbi:MAG: DUF2785 domain-containing protein [Pseudomonadota bacterium]
MIGRSFAPLATWGVSLALLLTGVSGLAQATQVPTDRAELEAWRVGEFQTDDPNASLMLLARLMQDVDPFLRDEIGFTGLSAILRRGDGDRATARQLIDLFTARLQEPDPAGVRRSFAILGLSELARVDRLHQFLSDEEFSGLVSTASQSLREVRDYRGYDPDVGWRHAIAHSSDFALQLVLNDRTDADQHAVLRAAVAAQVAPAAPYVHGESQRLARPILYMALHERASASTWQRWFEELAQANADVFDGATTTLERLAARHNLRRFLLEVYGTAQSSDREALQPLADEALALLRRLGG